MKASTLPTAAEVARSALGPFKPLMQWPEFQTALAGVSNGQKPAKRTEVDVTEAAPTPSSRWQLYVIAALGATVVGLLAAAYLLSRFM